MNEILDDKELKKNLLEILDTFVSYCDDNNLLYMLDGGTLLGAVRHKGFIPWDDDIDVIMPRDDYDKFISLTNEKEISNRFKVEALSIGNSPYPFAKVLDKTAKIINSKSKLHTYLWIDIFPIDGYKYISDKQLKKDVKQLSKWAFLLENACCEYGSGKTLINKIAKIPVIFFAKLRGAEYYGNIIDNFCRRYKIQDCQLAAECAWGALNAFINKEGFLNTTTVEFEGKKYNAPSNWDEYLKKMYGDYMKLPPVSERVNHGTKAIKVSL